MRLTPVSTIFALSSVALFTHALPLTPAPPSRRTNPQRRTVQYSVVPVDGGSSAVPVTRIETRTVTQNSDVTKTVTQPPTTLPATTETVVSIVAVTESDRTKTVTVSVSQETNTASSQTLSSTEVVQPGSSSNSASCSTSRIIPSYSAPSPISVTMASTSGSLNTTSSTLSPQVTSSAINTHSQPTVSSTYDDGLYHTSYPSWNASSSVFTISASGLGTTLPTLPSQTGDSGLPGTPVQRLPYNPTSSLPDSPTMSSSPMPKLSSTMIDPALSTEVPSIIVAEEHKEPVVKKTFPSPTGSLASWNGSAPSLYRRRTGESDIKKMLL